MKTKICRGPLHSGGVELPVTSFSFYYKTYVRKKDGIISKYLCYCPRCKKCFANDTKRQYYENPEYYISIRIKHRKTNKAKIKRRKDAELYRKKHPDKVKNIKRISYHKSVVNLTYWYVKNLFEAKFKRRKMIPPKFTSDIWIAESIRIQTIRKNRKPKSKL